ncbi:MAG: vWA domain-containing protein [Thermoleophilia bacterium]
MVALRIPLADAPALAPEARRTALLRIGLAAGVVLAAILCLLLARRLDSQPSSYFAGGTSGVVVVDFSTSIDPGKYRRIDRVLRTIVRTSQPVGLVAYSDSAYEVVPPGTRGDVLRPVLRFFEPGSPTGRQLRNRFADSPWTGTFRGGTRISTGLRVAREALAREHVARGSVLLVSDLDDSAFDTAALTQEAVRYREAGVRLRLIPLFPSREDRELFTRLLGRNAFVGNRELLRNSRLEGRSTLVGRFPWALVAAAVGLLALLAVNEGALGALGWRRKAVA